MRNLNCIQKFGRSSSKSLTSAVLIQHYFEINYPLAKIKHYKISTYVSDCIVSTESWPSKYSTGAPSTSLYPLSSLSSMQKPPISQPVLRLARIWLVFRRCIWRLLEFLWRRPGSSLINWYKTYTYSYIFKTALPGDQ